MTRAVGAWVGAIAALGLIAAASAASPATLKFTYTETGPGAIEYSFEQSTNPTPISYGLGEYTQVPIWDATGIFGGQTSVVWYSSSFGGGYDLYGPQVYTGPESAPVFAPGIFNEYDPFDGLTGTLTFSLPEPSAWTMMLIGIGTVGAALRRARRQPGADVRPA